MWDLLTRINREGTTIILTTHYLEEAENLCRHIAIINHGKIIEHSTVDDLLARMHVNRYVLDLAAPMDHNPVIPGCRVERLDAKTLQVEVPAEVGIHAVFNQLETQGLRVVSLRNSVNRLEQLFLDLVDAEVSV